MNMKIEKLSLEDIFPFVVRENFGKTERSNLANYKHYLFSLRPSIRLSFYSLTLLSYRKV